MSKEDVDALVARRLEQARAALDDAAWLMQGERSQQGIVNRLYYAMFYAALALLQKIGRAPSKHTGVIALFDKEFVLKGVFPRETSRHFHRAFELRQASDYRVTNPLSSQKLLSLLEEATAFVDAVASHLARR